MGLIHAVDLARAQELVAVRIMVKTAQFTCYFLQP